MPNNFIISITTYRKVTFMSHSDKPVSWWLFYSCLTHNLIRLCLFSPPLTQSPVKKMTKTLRLKQEAQTLSLALSWMKVRHANDGMYQGFLCLCVM